MRLEAARRRVLVVESSSSLGQLVMVAKKKSLVTATNDLTRITSGFAGILFAKLSVTLLSQEPPWGSS